MLKAGDKRGRTAGFPRSAMYGVLLALALCSALSALGAALVSGETISENVVPACSTVICAVSSCVGAIFAAKRCRGRLLALGLAVGGALSVISLVASASGGGPLFDAGLLRSVCAFLAGGALGAVLCARRGRRKRS